VPPWAQPFLNPNGYANASAICGMFLCCYRNLKKIEFEFFKTGERIECHPDVGISIAELARGTIHTIKKWR
jgi:hypothetical protein